MGEVIDFNKHFTNKMKTEKDYKTMNAMIEEFSPYMTKEEYDSLIHARDNVSFEDFYKLYDRIEIAIVMRGN